MKIFLYRFRPKDQSYFLYSLSQKQLSRTLFPLGEFKKRHVRDMAVSYGLHTSEKAESQDFIGDSNYSYLFMENESREGDIVNSKGCILGKHRGIITYTIGQRKKLSIASSAPLYVNKLDAPNKRVVVGSREELFSKGLIARDVNLIALDRLERPCRVKAKIRYRHREADAVLTACNEKGARVIFDEPQLR